MSKNFCRQASPARCTACLCRKTTPRSARGERTVSSSRSTGRSAKEDASGSLYLELTRLRNELREKEADLSEKYVEIRTLQNTVIEKDSALEKAEYALSIMRDKMFGLEGAMAMATVAVAGWWSSSPFSGLRYLFKGLNAASGYQTSISLPASAHQRT
jgi:hypothetical protein